MQSTKKLGWYFRWGIVLVAYAALLVYLYSRPEVWYSASLQPHFALGSAQSETGCRGNPAPLTTETVRRQLKANKNMLLDKINYRLFRYKAYFVEGYGEPYHLRRWRGR